jgi:hypothetical protein
MKAVFDTIEAVPEPIRGEYESRDGKFVLKIDGDHPALTGAVADANKKLGEFRDNNVKILKAIGADSFDDAFRKIETFKSVDPAEYRKAKDRLEELEKKSGVRDSGDIAALVARELETHVKPLQAKVLELEGREKAAKDRFSRKSLENSLQSAAMKAGVDEKAVSDFVYRGLQVFTAEEDGNVIAKRADGSPVFSKRKAGAALTPDEWALDLAEEAPHLFKKSTGGGAGGGRGSSTTDRWVDGTSAMEIGKNLEDIASGRAKVNFGDRT